MLTACCDESQGQAQAASLAAQTGVFVDHMVIRGFGFLDSQKEIHRLALKYSQDYDFFLKLDGDMVFAEKNTLRNLSVELDRWSEQFDRLTFPVNDFFLNKQIPGCHIWVSKKTPTEFICMPPRGDAWISRIPGKICQKTEVPYIYHAHSPSLSQSVRFGLNRASKAIRFGATNEHWGSLVALERACIESRLDARRGTALLGAGIAIGILPLRPPGPDDLDADSLEDLGILDFCAEQEKLGHPMLRPQLGQVVRNWYLHTYPKQRLRFQVHNMKVILKMKMMALRWPDF